MNQTDTNSYVKSLLTFQEDSSTSVLLGILLKEFGTDIFSMDPEALRLDIQDRYGIKLHHIPENRIQTGIMSMVNNAWTKDIYQFNVVANGFGDGLINNEVFEPATPEEIGWTLVEYNLMNPPDKNEAPLEKQLGNDVLIYISKLLQFHAIRPVGVFSFLSDRYSVPVIDETDAILANAGFTLTELEYNKVKDYIEENLRKMIIQVTHLGIQSKTLSIPSLDE